MVTIGGSATIVAAGVVLAAFGPTLLGQPVLAARVADRLAHRR